MQYASVVLAIDPGPEKTAYAAINREDLSVYEFGIKPNEEMLNLIRGFLCHVDVRIEMIASYGMAVGASVFNTCVWIGRFKQVALDSRANSVDTIFRKDVKLCLCGNPRAKDANIRQAIIDKYEALHGGSVTKKNGMLHKASKDVWAAIGVGLTAIEKEKENV